MTRTRIAGRCAWLVVALGGCPGDTPGTGETEAASGTDGSGTATDPDGGPGVDSSGDGTGGPGSALEPCDPTAPDPCDEGVCAGASQAGFYCRPACSDMAEVGTDCGSDDVCLPVGAGNDGLACFDVIDCDLITGAGCDVAAGDSCVAVSLDPLRTACVPSGNSGAGVSCDPLGMHDCAPGLACLGADIDGDDPGVCTPLCLPGDPLPSGCPQCTPLNDEIGTCAECTALDDDCPKGQQCQPVNEFFGGVCVDHGPVGAGEPCNPLDPAMACQAGHLCLEAETDDVFVCVQTCDRAAPMCDGSLTCVDVGLFVPGVDPNQLGVCIETAEQYCDPDAMPTGCDAGEICLAVEPGIGVCGTSCDPTLDGLDCDANQICLPEADGAVHVDPFVVGNGVCGTGCSGDGDCGGGTCLLVDGIDVDGVCGASCTPGMGGCPAGAQCVATPGNPAVGACVVSGAACDPALIGECTAPTAVCVALDGGGAGACMFPCFVSDPMACVAVGASCHVKTDPIWHGGVCLGGGPTCDPIAQDCGAGQTCGVTGGGPIGGNAILCDDAGMIAEGGDCSGDDGGCAPGLYCLEDTCVATCDPAAPACARGTCTDISAAFYLPASTVGACL